MRKEGIVEIVQDGEITFPVEYISVDEGKVTLHVFTEDYKEAMK